MTDKVYCKKGIVLAGGTGSRLQPITRATSKQLLPVYDKPLVYYPLSTLMMAGIRQFLLISTPADRPGFERLLGDGQSWGISVAYCEQSAPRGIAEAFLLANRFIAGQHVALVLGDNIFFGGGLPELLQRAVRRKAGATIFAQAVAEANRYGVVEFDDQHNILSLEEKPQQAKSNYAVTGIYFYDPDVVQIAAQLIPSPRGELEITDVNGEYLRRNQLIVERLDEDFAWFDTGSPDSLFRAASFVRDFQDNGRSMIGCPEEVAYRQGFITAKELQELARQHAGTDYGDYLARLVAT